MGRSGSDKYLRYGELARIVQRADACSALLVYQHLQRNKRQIAGDILDKAVRLTRVLPAPSVGYVTDDDVVFFGVGMSENVHEMLITELERYGERHSLAGGRLSILA